MQNRMFINSVRDIKVTDFQKAFVLLREQIVIGGRLPKFRGLFTIALRQQRRIDGADGNTADDIKMITQFGKGAVCADLIGAFGTRLPVLNPA